MSEKKLKRIYFREMDPVRKDTLKSLFIGSKNGFLFCGDVKYVIRPELREALKNTESMKLYPDDVFVASFPRSGTTWTQEITWLINNNMDFEKARNTFLSARYYFLEFGMTLSEKIIEDASKEKRSLVNVFYDVSDYPKPRHIKTHLHMSLLPPSVLETSKVIYVARNPLDAAVSFYHHNKLFKTLDYQGDFKTFWKLFTDDLVTMGPYFPHVKQAWAQRNHPNMLFMFYEDMTKDIHSCVRKVAKFLGKEYTDEQFQQLCDHVQFDNVKKNKSLSQDYSIASDKMVHNDDKGFFFRKGKVGGWREYFDEEMTEQAEKWLQDNLKGTDLVFPPF